MTQGEIQFQTHSDTSREAARRVAGGAHSLRMKVYELIRSAADGLTDEEIQDALSMNPSTQRPRRVELVRMGLVRDSGIQRLTRSERFATVWIATTR